MSIAETKTDLASYCRSVAQRAKAASRELAGLRGEVKNRWLRESAARLRSNTDKIIAANKLDLAAAPGFGLSSAEVDRLKLSTAGVEKIAFALEEVAMLPDPVGEVIEAYNRPNGLSVSRVRSPLGVVFFIYESRPNVTADAAAICVKSGNAVILRGGKEAAHSSAAIVDVLMKSPPSADCPNTPCNSSLRPIATPWGISSRCLNILTWRFRAAAKDSFAAWPKKR